MSRATNRRRAGWCVRALGVGVLGLFAGAARAQETPWQLPAFLSDHMVVQRESRARFWGCAGPGEEISVSADWPRGGEAAARADDRGQWEVELPTPAAGGPYTVTIRGSRTTVLRDVMVGEVWVCSGQSNMEWTLGQTDERAEAVAAADAPMIRLFTVGNRTAASPMGACGAEGGGWVLCSPTSAEAFSAVGFHFAREVHGALNVPVGMISATWGGTRIEAWMSAEALRAFPAHGPELDRLHTLSMDPVNDPSRARVVRAGWWRQVEDSCDPSPGRDWTGPDFDDSAWMLLDQPQVWSGDELKAFDGVVYFRRRVEVPAWLAEGEANLELGPIDDMDSVFVNGVRVGETIEDHQWTRPRRYSVPAGVLRHGTNTLAVRVVDTMSDGGFGGREAQMMLKPAASGRAGIPVSGPWRVFKGAALSALPAYRRAAVIDANSPSALYNGMIAPLTKYPIQGVVWYQGESNVPNAAPYRELFPVMIRDWRRAWGRPELPFSFVQIAPYGYENDRGEAAELRESQAAALTMPGTTMAVTLDVGDPYDIHPRRKREVGRRLALNALATVYHKPSVVHRGPTVRASRAAAGSFRVEFDDATGGLTLKDEPKALFTVAGADRRFFEARAVVEGDSVVLSSEKVSNPVAARYAWEAAAGASLFNNFGLPAAPFRTDSWERPTDGWGPVGDDGRTPYLRLEEDSVPMLDGAALRGWVAINGSMSAWNLADGVLTTPGAPVGLLRTSRQYENFVLDIEWRFRQPKGNSGVLVWSDGLPQTGTPFPRCLGVQMIENPAALGLKDPSVTGGGDISAANGATMMAENAPPGSQRARPVELRTRGSPRWNHYRVTCRDGTISLAVNGRVVTSGRGSSLRRGYIALESEGFPVQFRNMYLRELPSSTPPPRLEECAEADRGNLTLFNGQNFDGWKFTADHRGLFEIGSGVLRARGPAPDLTELAPRKNFVLRGDWRWTSTSSGGAVANAGPGEPVALPLPASAGIMVRGSTRIQIAPQGSACGRVIAPGAPAESARELAGDGAGSAVRPGWNRFLITVEGDRVTVVINGATVAEAQKVPAMDPSGPIGLRVEQGAIEFANLFVYPLE